MMAAHICRFTAVDDELFGKSNPISITLPRVEGEYGVTHPGAVWCWPGGHWVNLPLFDGGNMEGVEHG